MPPGGKKQARYNNPPPAPKAVPSWALAPIHSGRRLSWAFSSPDLNGEWAWSKMSDADMSALIQRLGQIEKLDLQSIKDQRSIVAFDRLEKPAQARLVEIKRDDIPELYGWHVGLARAWFADYDGVQHALWWDPTHTVFKTPKKNT